MKFSHRWWMVVALLFAFAATVSFLSAQTEEPSAVDAPSSAAVQSDSVEVQSSSDEPEQEQPVPAPNRDMIPAAGVENDHRLNELQREFFDYRAKMIDWWLMFLAIVIPVIAIIGGIFSFRRFTEIKDEAQRHLEEVRAIRDKSEVYLASLQAILFERQKKIDEAIKKWRSVANIAEGTNNELAADAWFNIGYLLSPKNVAGENRKGAIDAYNKAIALNLSGPDLVHAYYNLGIAKAGLGQFEEALADYDEAIRLNPYYDEAYYNRGHVKIELNRIEEARQDFDKTFHLAQGTGNEDLVANAKRAIESLPKGDSP